MALTDLLRTQCPQCEARIEWRKMGRSDAIYLGLVPPFLREADLPALVDYWTCRCGETGILVASG